MAPELAQLLAGPPGVVAAGGGAVLWDGLSKAAAGWRVFWLDADPKTLAQRVAGTGRPSLTGRPPQDEIADIARERAALYDAVAEHRIDTTEGRSGTIAKRIDQLLKNEPQEGSRTAD